MSARSSYRAAGQIWQNEIVRARSDCAARGLDDTSTFMGCEVSLRWIYIHMSAGYARH